MADETEEVSITRSVELEADVDDVWEAVTTPEQLSGWLEGEVDLDVRPGGDGVMVEPGGGVRRMRIDQVQQPDRLVLHWWPEDGSSPASTVVLDLEPVPGGTRLVVTETLHGHRAMASAVTSAATATATARWDLRLLLLGCSLLRPLVACW